VRNFLEQQEMATTDVGASMGRSEPNYEILGDIARPAHAHRWDFFRLELVWIASFVLGRGITERACRHQRGYPLRKQRFLLFSLLWFH